MLQYRILDTGFFYADGGAMFGAVPKRAWSRRYPSDEQNCCKMAMRCLLAWNEQRIFVLDTGVGNKDLGELSYYHFHDLYDIALLVRSHGFEPEQVTDVVLSHLHFDHGGGCTYRDEHNQLKITFPNAIHWIGKRQWESYLKPNYLEEDAFRKEDLMPVFEAGLINQIEADTHLSEDFELGLYDGHTDAQLVSFLDTIEGKIVYPGDVIPTKAHLSTGWISAYDIRPLESVAAKIRLTEKLAGEKGKIIPYHDAFNKILDI